MLANTFWENFLLLVIFLPLVLVWGFALVDIFRRDDIGGPSKALWVACVILVPFFGTLIYLFTRPSGSDAQALTLLESGSGARYAPATEASELQVLADLHDRGKLTDTEFSAEKERILGSRRAVPA